MTRGINLALVSMLAVLAGAPAAQAADPIGDLIQKAGRMIERVTDLQLRATLYHAGAGGVGSRDSLGCAVVPMRTLAVDPTVIPRHTIVFIKETVGMMLPDGTLHDGMWYASDIGGAIKGSKVDLYTGDNRASMAQFVERGLNVAVLNAAKVGAFDGCPPK